MIQRALLRTFFRELIRRARSDTVQAAEKCSRQSVRLVAQIKQPMRAQNRKRAPASHLIIWPAIPHGLGYLPTPGWRANPSPCLHSSLCERQICHCFWQNHSRLLLQRQGLQKCYRSKGPPSALLTVQMAYSLQRGAQGYFSIPATRHVAPAPCCAVASVHPPQRHGIQPAPKFALVQEPSSPRLQPPACLLYSAAQFNLQIDI